MLCTITATSNGSSPFAHKYYAAEVASLTTFQTIYAMMQCTPDVFSGDCEYCLKKTVYDYKSCCRGNKGGAYVRPFCFIRWDLYSSLELLIRKCYHRLHHSLYLCHRFCWLLE